jgi:hypothetical protein
VRSATARLAVNPDQQFAQRLAAKLILVAYPGCKVLEAVEGGPPLSGPNRGIDPADQPSGSRADEDNA